MTVDQPDMHSKLAIAALLLVASSAQADKRPGVAGTVALTTASLSGRGPALLRKVKRASAARAVFTDHEGWRVHYALAVPHALPSAEITLKISDITRGKHPVCTRHKIIYSEAAVTRGQFTLTRDQVVSPNAKLLLEIESDGEAIARQTFYIQGKPAAGSTTVEFSEDEANSADDEDDVKDVATRRR